MPGFTRRMVAGGVAASAVLGPAWAQSSLNAWLRRNAWPLRSIDPLPPGGTAGCQPATGGRVSHRDRPLTRSHDTEAGTRTGHQAPGSVVTIGGGSLARVKIYTVALDT